jgi:hypothetical protein
MSDQAEHAAQRSNPSRFPVLALVLLSLPPVAISLLYLVDETYGQWAIEFGWSSSLLHMHGGPGGVPMVLYTLAAFILLAILALAVGVRMAWLVLHGRNVGRLLTAWIVVLVICLGIFAPTHNQYAASAAVVFGPGKNSDRLQRDIVRKSWSNERYWPLFR